MRSRILCILIALSLFFGFHTAVFADQVSDLKNQETKAQQNAQQAKGKLDQAKQSQAEYSAKKKELDSQMSQVASRIREFNSQISQLQSEIDTKEAEITRLTELEDENRELFQLRMRALYEDNTASYLDILLSSTSLSDFFYRIDVIRQLAEYDQMVISDIVDQKEKVEEATRVLTQKKSEVSALKKKEDDEQKKLSSLINENAQTLTKLEQDIATYKKEYEKFEKESASIQAKIKSLSSPGVSGAPATYSGGVMAWPAPGYSTITSSFGNRLHPVLNVYKLHTGIDIGAPSGASVVAASDGTVIVSGYSNAYGNYIVIDHGGGITTLYGHHSANLVSQGAVVKRGQKIAKVGSTGWATGPHLHFEVSVNGVLKNPLDYLR